MRRISRYGEAALLVEADPDQVLGLCAALAATRPPGVLDLVPAERSLAVLVDPVQLSLVAAQRWVADTRPLEVSTADGETVIEVSYLGEDLAEAAAGCGLPPEQLVQRHVEATWQVAFMGFAPGFGYLTARAGWGLRVPRRAEPRVRVPAGSVAIAGPYTGVYPRSSPGGWQLIGRTAAAMWAPDRDPPALLRPGTTVRFAALSRAAGPLPEPARGDPASGDPASREPASADPAPGERVSGDPAAADGSAPSSQAAARELRVLRPGPLTTVQDLGRPGAAHLGLTRSGAADRAGLALANRLVGNPPGSSALEVTVGGLLVESGAHCTVAVTGAATPVRHNDRPAATHAVLHLAPGDRVELGPALNGCRGYLAVRGGIAVQPVLGAKATDTLAGLSPLPVRAGTRLPIGDEADGWPLVDSVPPPQPAGPSAEPAELAVLPGPDSTAADGADRLAQLAAAQWRVGPDSDRVGLRLTGSPLGAPAADGATQPLVRGAIQLPPSGLPIVFLADHPVTGGYPVIGCLGERAVDRAAQLRPGEAVRFAVQFAPGARRARR